MGGIWVGDVWKAIAEIRNFKNLDICVCTIDHGVSIIKVRENSNLPKSLNVNFKKLDPTYIIPARNHAPLPRFHPRGLSAFEPNENLRRPYVAATPPNPKGVACGFGLCWIK